MSIEFFKISLYLYLLSFLKVELQSVPAIHKFWTALSEIHVSGTLVIYSTNTNFPTSVSFEALIEKK